MTSWMIVVAALIALDAVTKLHWLGTNPTAEGRVNPRGFMVGDILIHLLLLIWAAFLLGYSR